MAISLPYNIQTQTLRWGGLLGEEMAGFIQANFDTLAAGGGGGGLTAPVLVNQGGTGAITAPLALTNLGLSANGQALVATTYNSMRTLLSLVPGTDVQAYSSVLTTLTGASANGQSLITAADYATMRTLLGLVIGTNVQAYSAVLTTLTGASSNGQSLITAGNYAAMRGLLSLGTAALKDAGTSAGQVLLMAVDNQLPALDGSLLTGVPGLTFPTANTTASYAFQAADKGKTFVFTGALGSGVVLTISPATLTAANWLGVDNQGTGPATITASSGTIELRTSIVIYPGERFIIRGDGTNLWAIGRRKRVLVESFAPSANASVTLSSVFSALGAAVDSEAVTLEYEGDLVSAGSGAAPGVQLVVGGVAVTTNYSGGLLDKDNTSYLAITGASQIQMAPPSSTAFSFKMRVTNPQSGAASGTRIDIDYDAAGKWGKASGVSSSQSGALSGIKFIGNATLTSGSLRCYINRE